MAQQKLTLAQQSKHCKKTPTSLKHDPERKATIIAIERLASRQVDAISCLLLATLSAVDINRYKTQYNDL
jgi:hypothetical protein